ncbi:MAG: hypothetical protein ACE5I3_03735 [Phycisphaerae bacterium]
MTSTKSNGIAKLSGGMTADRTESAPFVESAPADSGLRCPGCEYNLTGLTEPRCPECGAAFDWDEVRRAAANVPTITFERARGWRKLPAFLVTWATVLLAPWIFARQIVARVDWRHALPFAGACFASTSFACLFGFEADFVVPWVITAATYLGLQTLWLSLIDVRHWGRPLATLRFWALAGCYTSAVMLTEFKYGPPPVFVGDLWQLVTTGKADWITELYELSIPSVVCWTQTALWLVGLGCIYANRVVKRPGSLHVIVFAVVACFSLLVLYAVAVDWIGQRIYGWVDDWL